MNGKEIDHFNLVKVDLRRDLNSCFIYILSECCVEAIKCTQWTNKILCKQRSIVTTDHIPADHLYFAIPQDELVEPVQTNKPRHISLDCKVGQKFQYSLSYNTFNSINYILVRIVNGISIKFYELILNLYFIHRYTLHRSVDFKVLLLSFV